MIALLVGLVSGYVIAMPPGPVAAYAITSTLERGRRAGLMVGVGVAVVDAIFCMLILFASSALSEWVMNMVNAHPYLTMAVKVLIIIGLVVYTISQFLKKTPVVQEPRVHLEERVHSNKPFIIGAATAFSNVFVPTFLPALTALLSTIAALVPQIHVNLFDKFMFIVGFGTGTYGWIHSVVAFVSRHHASMPPQLMMYVRRGGAAILLIFALYMAWKVFFL